MRAQGLATAAVVVMLTTNRHKPEDAQYYATRHVRLTDRHQRHRPADPRGSVGPAGDLQAGGSATKCGILLLDLHPAQAVQGSLFLRPDRPERSALMQAMDALNARYGRDRVRYACSGQDRPWKLRAEYLSQRYTTRWGELLAIR
ncbi:DUF4113 domain-containing protein [Methylorubrum populi]|uniref:DUF4113 domain-containing protein n=1 Tax=Methylorubrum populi TaxID=223967 RepID=UPI003F659429